jgi:hypothetical protein
LGLLSNIFFRSFDFEFLPDRRDVGKNVVVKSFFVSIGRPDSNLEIEIELNVDGDDEEELEAKVFSGRAFKKDLETPGSESSFSKIEIEPRSPNLKMELHYKGLF